jgi:hypothetical protein
VKCLIVSHPNVGTAQNLGEPELADLDSLIKVTIHWQSISFTRPSPVYFTLYHRFPRSCVDSLGFPGIPKDSYIDSYRFP